MESTVPKVFVGYAGEDEEIATEVAGFLKRKKIQVWFAPWEIRHGDSLIKEIFEKQFPECQFFIPIISDTFKSKTWPMEELRNAYARQLDGKIKVIPVLLANCVVPEFLASRYYCSLDPETMDKKALEALLMSIRENAVDDFPAPKDGGDVIDIFSRKKLESPEAIDRPNQTATGKNITQVGGNFYQEINKYEKPPSKKVVVQPGPQHIEEHKALKIKKIVQEAVEDAEKAGIKKRGYGFWHGRLNNHFGVTTLKMLPRERGDEAIDWLREFIAVELQPKLRRRDNPTWRKNRYKGIHARIRQLGFGDEWVYDFASQLLGKPVDSLKKLGERDLDKIYKRIMQMN